MEAFHSLGTSSPIDLIIKISAGHKSATVSAANQNKGIPLSKATIEISENLN